MHKFLSFIFLFTIGFTNYAQSDQAKIRVQQLCSEDFHGRGYVNGGDSIAAFYIASIFDSIGVQKVDGSFFQEFNFQVNTFPGEMALRCDQAEFTPGVDFIVDPASPSYSGSYKLVHLELETILDQDKLIRILQENKAKRNIAYVVSISGQSKDTVVKLKETANELTALAMVFLETDDKFTWSVARGQRKYPLVEIKPELLTCERIQVDIDARMLSAHKARNVIGFIPGVSHKKKIVFTAHYDHLGRMGKKTYFPGGNDNASGTAMLITMAEHFKMHKPKYDVYFIAFAGEEAGLLGSEYFVQNPLIKLKKIGFLINLDIMGSGEDGVTVVNATVHPEKFEQLKKVNETANYLPQIKERGPAANSDHYWFAEAGVPAIFIYTMGPNKHYHDVFDTYEELSFAAYDNITKLLISYTENLTF